MAAILDPTNRQIQITNFLPPKYFQYQLNITNFIGYFDWEFGQLSDPVPVNFQFYWLIWIDLKLVNWGHKLVIHFA